jgi:GGDEF domain-containing protein
MNDKLLQEFEDAVREKLPGYITIFNLADTKRRNLYLGHEAVDQDIRCFDELLSKNFFSDDFAKRVGGNEWLCFSKSEPEPIIKKLLNDYTNRSAIILKFISQATTQNEAARIVKKEYEAQIARAFRCLREYVANAGELNSRINELIDNVYKSAVNSLTSLNEVKDRTITSNSKWRCVDDEKFWQPVCINCNGEDFDWIDGADDCCYGICKSCRAECDFRYAPDA